jgi:hypothetical protein
LWDGRNQSIIQAALKIEKNKFGSQKEKDTIIFGRNEREMKIISFL